MVFCSFHNCGFYGNYLDVSLPQCNIDGAVTSSKVVNNNTRDNYNPIVPAKIVVSLSFPDRERERDQRLKYYMAFDCRIIRNFLWQRKIFEVSVS